MLDLLTERTISCEELEEGRSCGVLLNFLKRSLQQGNRVDALIDCGALLAGTTIFSVAHYLLNECLLKENSNLRGVTFFDKTMKPSGNWVIMDVSGRCTPKDQAPLSEAETFAIYDEPRCRGVDLKLDKDAIAIVTLGKNMCKDKFMQAAG